MFLSNNHTVNAQSEGIDMLINISTFGVQNLMFNFSSNSFWSDTQVVLICTASVLSGLCDIITALHGIMLFPALHSIAISTDLLRIS